ncbi:MAG: M28 family peptidase [Saprospirales bacterium]|nr:M28 family peptidase [Saprospirales bacterium]
MRRITTILLISFTLFAPQALSAQGSFSQAHAEELGATIQAADMKHHLDILASDAFEGRETGEEGQRKAAAYISSYFYSLGLPPIGDNNSYYQQIAYTAENWNQVALSVNKSEFRHLWDYVAFPATNSDKGTQEFKEVVFLGYGIDDTRYSDYQGVDVKGKVVMVYLGEPLKADSTSWITGTRQLTEWSTNWRLKLKTARKWGAAGILLIDWQIQKTIADQRRLLLSPGFRIGRGEEPEKNYANNVFISPAIAQEIMGKKYKKVIKARDRILETGASQSIVLKCDLVLTQEKRMRQIIGENVLGYIEGTDPKLKDELVVVTAHYDHLGKKKDIIYNGADDNASGTSTVLEIAQALVKAKEEGYGPRRSVLCMLVSGEEKGLLGSKYYVENPVFPLKNTIADINIDMVGRTDEKHADNPNYIYVIGSDRLSDDLHAINEEMNSRYTNLELDYTYNAEDDPNRYYYRSDHYNFAEQGIPSIFYFSGIHEDYHQPTDDADKILFDKMEHIGKLIFQVTWELANRDERIRLK